MSAARTQAACDASVAAEPFDWTAWNAQFDAGMVGLKASLDRWNATEAAIEQAGRDLVSDLSAMINKAQS